MHPKKMLCMQQHITEMEKFQMKVQSEATVDYASYKKAQEKAIPKFKYYAKLFAGIKKDIG